jgi:hypothetical protein
VYTRACIEEKRVILHTSGVNQEVETQDEPSGTILPKCGLSRQRTDGWPQHGHSQPQAATLQVHLLWQDLLSATQGTSLYRLVMVSTRLWLGVSSVLIVTTRSSNTWSTKCVIWPGNGAFCSPWSCRAGNSRLPRWPSDRRWSASATPANSTRQMSWVKTPPGLTSVTSLTVRRE